MCGGNSLYIIYSVMQSDGTVFSSAQHQFYDFLVVKRCYTLEIHFLQSLLKLEIFVIQN